MVEPRVAAVRVGVEPAGVGRLVVCLLGLAIAATPPGGRIAARALVRGGSAVVEVDHTAGAPGPAVSYDLTVLTSSAIALGGSLERGLDDQGLARLTLTLPGNERR